MPTIQDCRRKISAAKDRINHQLIQVQALQLDETLPPELNNTVLNQRKEITNNHLNRLQRHITTIQTYSEQWSNLANNNDAERNDYNASAEGPDGFESLLTSAGELAADLETRLKTIDDRIRQQTPQANNQDRVEVPLPPIPAVHPQSQVKLPEIKLQHFSGDKRKWAEFWDNFRSCIHEHPTLQKVQKFSYLKGILSSSAADVISGLQTTDVNYDLAVNLLEKKFGDKHGQLALLYADWNNLPAATMKFTDLQKLHDSAEKIIRQLQIQGDTLTNSNLAIQQLKQKIPNQVLIDLEKDRDFQYEWSLEKLISALEKYLKVRQTVFEDKPMIAEKRYESITRFSNDVQSSDNESSALVSDSKNRQMSSDRTAFKKPCIFCKGMHYNEDCSQFKTSSDRRDKLKSERRCFICFSDKHLSSQCPRAESNICSHCKKNNHNRALCVQKFPSRTVSNQPQSSVSINCVGSKATYSPLLTAMVTVRKPNSDKFLSCRLVLDTASQLSFGLTTVADQLNLSLTGSQNLSVSTFGSSEQKNLNAPFGEVEMFLKNGSLKSVTLNFIPTIVPNLKRERLDNTDLEYLKQFDPSVFADKIPKCRDSFCPDILIGNDFFWDFVILNQTQQRLPSGLILIPSTFGLLLGGRTENTENESKDPRQSVCISAIRKMPDNISEATLQLSQQKNAETFWSLETLGITDSVNKSEDDMVLSKFESDLVFENNRYHASFPWKQENPKLPDNFGLSLGRFKSLSKRLLSDDDLLKKYADIIAEQKAKGITEIVDRKIKPQHLVHYLPHHPVITPLKTTTKVRIVFDASSKTDIKVNSLNDCLYSGPNFLPDLCGMLLRFRLPKIAIVADIEKAFLQIGLRMPDRDVTRFLWFANPTNPKIDDKLSNLAVYRFCRVPFGVISSPFLLEATLKHHLRNKNCELAFEIEQNLYMDNVIISANSLELAQQKYMQAKKMFLEGSFNLREWTSNSAEFNSKISANDHTASEQIKILGLSWNLNSDRLGNCHLKIEKSQKLTKRMVLKTVASIFDPLGFWTPATFFGKVFFQSLWLENFHWDSNLPPKHVETWDFALNAVNLIQKHAVPRKAIDYDCEFFRLVVFCDASSKSYGCAIYIVSESENKTSARLLFSKMRLNPVKNKSKNELSIPRLELLAVLIGTRLLNFVKKQLKEMDFQKSVLFTDSQCVLYWLDSKKPLSTFVQNRVNEILKAENIEFRYVASEENPADLLTKEFAPWQGGIYERIVGIVKSCLRKSVGKRLLQASQMQTLLCEVEAMVNSRPITYIPDEPADCPVLSPADFLNQRNSLVMPDFTPSDDDNEYLPTGNPTRVSLNDLWKKRTMILQDYWKLWQEHYLNSLKERPDYKHPKRKVQVRRKPVVGEVVIIKEERIPRGLWKVGKVTDLNVSNDMEIRSAKVQLPNKNVITRPLSLLFPLEIYSTVTLKNQNEDIQNPDAQPMQARSRRDAAIRCEKRIQNLFETDALILVLARMS